MHLEKLLIDAFRKKTLKDTVWKKPAKIYILKKKKTQKYTFWKNKPQNIHFEKKKKNT